MLTPSKAHSLFPAKDLSIPEGAIHIPKDGQTNRVDMSLSIIATGQAERDQRVRGLRRMTD